MKNELLEKIGAEIRLDICSLCKQFVLQNFLIENINVSIDCGLHKVMCFCWDYDDSGIVICLPHLKEIVTMMADKEGV